LICLASIGKSETFHELPYRHWVLSNHHTDGNSATKLLGKKNRTTSRSYSCDATLLLSDMDCTTLFTVETCGPEYVLDVSCRPLGMRSGWTVFPVILSIMSDITSILSVSCGKGFNSRTRKGCYAAFTFCCVQNTSLKDQATEAPLRYPYPQAPSLNPRTFFPLSPATTSKKTHVCGRSPSHAFQRNPNPRPSLQPPTPFTLRIASSAVLFSFFVLALRIPCKTTSGSWTSDMFQLTRP
jgi:hypothetical protein